jgi:protein gp37
MDPAWALAVMDQCKKAGVAVFFKQFGAQAARQLGIKHKKGGGDLSEFPEEFRIREFKVGV